MKSNNFDWQTDDFLLCCDADKELLTRQKRSGHRP